MLYRQWIKQLENISAQQNERLNKLEGAIFLLAGTMGRLDLLEEAGFEIVIKDMEGNVLSQVEE